MSTETKVRWRPRPDQPGDFIDHFDPQPGDRVVLVCRVSGYKQKRKKTLERHEANLRQEMSRLGVSVVACLMHEGSGVDPSWLREAVNLAAQHNATVVAMSTDRLIRTLKYHSEKNPDAVAEREDLLRLQWWTGGVPVATVLHPDTSPAKVRSDRVRRGHAATGRGGGRPAARPPGYLKERRQRRLAVVLRLHRRGLSHRNIESWTDVPAATIRRWLKAVV